jgi:hypothetical protein
MSRDRWHHECNFILLLSTYFIILILPTKSKQPPHTKLALQLHMKQHWTSRKNQKQKEFSNSNLEVMKGIIRDNESNTVFQDMREKGINVFFY